MKNLKHILLGAVVLAVVLSASACGKSEQKTEGPAEKAGATLGKAIDQATEKAGEAMTKAGEAMKEAGQKAKESVSEAVDKMKEDKK
jgi:outer membrane murein-binding lipoprotein Lpp